MASYELLDQTDEDSLHASRLLNVEERLYKRVTKRLLAPDSLVSGPSYTPPTPPPDASAADEAAAAKEAETQRLLERRRKWQEDTYLDFAAFDSNIVRAQLLLNSNERERKRYAEEKIKIMETAQAVRDTNAALHDQLREAQRILEVRKGYDELAEKITSNRNLRPREDQHAQLEKLNAEIAELQRESEEYAKTWAERREQFGKIVEEGMQMLRLIRDEKEEADRKEGMGDMETGDEREASPSRGENSYGVTPGGGATPVHISQTTEHPSPSQASKLRDGFLGVDAVASRDNQDASPAPRSVPNENMEDTQMTEIEDANADSRATPPANEHDAEYEIPEVDRIVRESSLGDHDEGEIDPQAGSAGTVTEGMDTT